MNLLLLTSQIPEDLHFVLRIRHTFVMVYRALGIRDITTTKQDQLWLWKFVCALSWLSWYRNSWSFLLHLESFYFPAKLVTNTAVIHSWFAFLAFNPCLYLIDKFGWKEQYKSAPNNLLAMIPREQFTICYLVIILLSLTMGKMWG
jgi:hypothetical protein